MPEPPVSLANEKILLTGPTSQVGYPLARALAEDNEVYGLARFGNASDRARIEGIGVIPLQVDLASDPLDSVPDDFSYVLNFAVVKTGRFDYDLAANAESVGRLMSRCRRAKAFLQCSSAAVYAPPSGRPAKEDDPLGDNHRCFFPTYSICKIAAETMARFGARQWNLPTTIARFSVPYGTSGGWPFFHFLMMQAGQAIPVHSNGPSLYNPIYEDDYIAQIPALLAVADVPARTLNWGGTEAVSVEQWCQYIGEITGLEPKFESTSDTLESLPLDLSNMHEHIGPTRVEWRDGIRRMLEALAPDALTPTA